MADQHERGGGGDLQRRPARRGDRRRRAVNGVSMRPRVEVSPADTCPSRYQGASDTQLRQTAWLRQRCDGHRMRVFARQRRVYREVARHWEFGPRVSHGGRRGALSSLLLWVCHHDSPGTRRITELWLYLVQSAQACGRQVNMSVYNRDIICGAYQGALCNHIYIYI